MSADPHGVDWILWSGTIGLESPLDARIEAAHAAGFTRVSISPLDLARAAEAGETAAQVGRRFASEGLGLVLDPVMNWHGGAPLPQSRFGRFPADDALRMAEAAGVAVVTVIGNPTTDGTLDDLTAAFAGVCDRVAGFGAAVQVEFIPTTVVPDLATAWSVVRSADRPGSGIVFDTWHFFRGDPDYTVLRGIPGDRVLGVQIDDAHAEVRGSMRDDMQNRLLPGDGAFDLPTVVAELDTIGALTWVGPEVISPVTAAMAPADAARVSKERVARLIETVRTPA